MNILINGAEVRDATRGNRGAEQLLMSAATRVRSMGYAPTVTVGQVDPNLRRGMGLEQYLGNPRLHRIDRMVPAVRIGGFATLRSIHGVLDASGYALGDPWGYHTAGWILRKYTQWKALGVKIIALPQAYGPFDEEGVRSSSKDALALCDLVYAREEQSYENLLRLGLSSDRLRICPDITIGEASEVPERPRNKRLVVVPNWNLAERGDSAAYLTCLSDAVLWGTEQGYDVVGLLHEGGKDLALLESLAARSPLKIIDSLSGWETKRYIAESSLVLAGRYHAVVAALSTGTPVITHSWSHKYKELLQQFGVVDWLRDPGDSEGTVAGLNEVIRADTSDVLNNKKELAGLVEKMWSEVAAMLAK